ncbi:MAG: hypothetical protein ABIZ57_10445, partial [Candidatus Limnocylindria bacterium]
MLRGLQHHLRIEARDEDERTADEQCVVHVDGQPVDVEERQRAEERDGVVAPGAREPGRHLMRVRHEVAVRQGGT